MGRFAQPVSKSVSTHHRPDNTASSRAAASRCAPAVAWVYVSNVMATERHIGGNGSLFVGEHKTFTFVLNVDVFGWAPVFDVRDHDNAATFIVEQLGVCVGQTIVVVLSRDQMNVFAARRYRYALKRATECCSTCP